MEAVGVVLGVVPLFLYALDKYEGESHRKSLSVFTTKIWLQLMDLETTLSKAGFPIRLSNKITSPSALEKHVRSLPLFSDFEAFVEVKYPGSSASVLEIVKLIQDRIQELTTKLVPLEKGYVSRGRWLFLSGY
jgi:hypothetical protein